jgi:hypothetical protein
LDYLYLFMCVLTFRDSNKKSPFMCHVVTNVIINVHNGDHGICPLLVSELDDNDNGLKSIKLSSLPNGLTILEP